MILKDLVDRNEWLSIALVFDKLYPDFVDSLEEHEQVFLTLKQLDAQPSSMMIKLTDYQTYIDISGLKKNQEESYAIEFRPWSEWLGMQLFPENLLEFTELEILAHCLFEMSYFGFNEGEIQDQIQQIEKLKQDYDFQKSLDNKEDSEFLNEYLKNIDLENENPKQNLKIK